MAELRRVADATAAAGAAADALGRAIEAARSARGQAHVALAGGTTPRAAYERLASRLCDWTGVTFWLGDERAVPDDDPEANARLVRETLPQARLEAVGFAGDVQAAAGGYEARLRAALGPAPVLDLALLGLGEDGHTASLFPGNPALDVRGRACVDVHDAPKPPPDRVTLTLEVLRAARERVFLVAGGGKAEAVAAALAGSDRAVPASLLQEGATRWILDEAAGARAG